MPIYDSTFILNPQLEEAGCDAHVKEFVNLINENGGKVIKETRIGMRRLAYEIKKLTQGYYVSLVFEGNHDLITKLERNFRLDESCLRFLTCHYQDFSRKPRVKTGEEHAEISRREIDNVESTQRTIPETKAYEAETPEEEIPAPEPPEPKEETEDRVEQRESEHEAEKISHDKERFQTSDDADAML